MPWGKWTAALLKTWLRNAFAVEAAGPAPPTDAERPIVERLCAEVVRRGMSVPVLLWLESARPLNALAAHALHACAPFLSAVVTGQDHQRFAEFIERRGSIEYLCRRIEELERERQLILPRPPQVGEGRGEGPSPSPSTLGEGLSRPVTNGKALAAETCRQWHPLANQNDSSGT